MNSKDILIATIFIVGTVIIVILGVLILIGELSTASYFAYKIDTIQHKNSKCKKKFEGTIEDIVNDTVKIIVKTKSYYINSLPKYNININDKVTVYSDCNYVTCTEDKIEYKNKFHWTAPKTEKNCGSSIALVVSVMFILCPSVIIVGTIMAISIWCTILGVIMKFINESLKELDEEKIRDFTDDLKNKVYGMETI